MKKNTACSIYNLLAYCKECSPVHLDLKFYGFFQLTIGKMALAFKLPEPASLSDLWKALGRQYPQLAAQDMTAIAAVVVNGQSVVPEKWPQIFLQDGDQIEFISLMAGG